MRRSGLRETEEFRILGMQDVGPMDLKTLTEIIQNKTEFSDQGVIFAFKQYVEGSSTIDTVEDALELLEGGLLKKYRPEVAREILAKQLNKK